MIDKLPLEILTHVLLFCVASEVVAVSCLCKSIHVDWSQLARDIETRVETIRQIPHQTDQSILFYNTCLSCIDPYERYKQTIESLSLIEFTELNAIWDDGNHWVVGFIIIIHITHHLSRESPSRLH